MTPYRLAADTFGPEEIAAAKATLDSGRLTMGESVARFEREFAAYVGVDYAVMVNSGSSANLLMVDVLLRHSLDMGLRPGDEVLVPALAWPTTVWPLVQLGLVPVFVDVDPNTLAIDLKSAEAAMSSRTHGMFLIHVLGQAAPLGQIAHFCLDRGLVLLEDACESLGAHFGYDHVGGTGVMGSFSFYFSHHLSTVEGGMVVTRHKDFADDLRSMRAHGWVRDRSDRDYWRDQYPEIDDRFMFIMPGYNVRPMEIQGAVGSVQLRKLDGMLRARKALAYKVRAQLPSWLELIGAAHLDNTTHPGAHSWMTLPLRLRSHAPVDLVVLRRLFENANVDTRPIIAGNLARHPALKRIKHRCAPSLGVADALLRNGLMIGCHPVPEPGAVETLESALAQLRAL